MEGTGARSTATGMAQLLADDLGHRLDNKAAGGTGYTNPGPPSLLREPFEKRIDEVVRTAPDVLVVAGGLTDYGYVFEQKKATIDDEQSAVDRTLSGLVDALPDTRIVVVGPFWPNGNPPSGMTVIDGLIRDEAQELGLTFIDPISERWITNDNKGDYVGPDRTQLTPAGHEYVANKIGEAMRR